jgi:glycosyltransferase involved in cell wall biosynthesis
MGFVLKILIVTDAWYPQLNGVVRTYEYLRGQLETMGYQVKIIGPADFKWSMAMPGYPEIRLCLFPYNALRRMIAAFGPADVLHIATEGPLGAAARKYAKDYGIEFTSCYHTHFPDYVEKRVRKYLPFLAPLCRKAAIRFVRNFHALSSCLFVATPSLEATLKEWDFKCPIKRMTRGIDHSVFFCGPKNLFADLKKPVALYVGRIAVEKNLDDFLSMPWDGEKVVVGDGPDFQSLKQKYPDAHFLGVRKGKDLADCYRSADVFVFPSKTDTFGMVLTEALACGLPIAAHPVTGPIDIVTDGFLGALNDNLSLAAKKALQCGMPEERSAHARTHYSWETATKQFLETD